MLHQFDHNTLFFSQVLPSPSTPEEWKEVAKGFQKRWNFPNTIGAIDGKHIAIRCPPNSGSIYHNYKGFFSIVLLAVVDADYKFIYVDVGRNGSCSDAEIFLHSNLRDALEEDFAGLPKADPLPRDDTPVPYALVGDDAFPLRSWLMKPYPFRGMSRQKRIFNYRLSRARRVVENAFGVMAARYKCFGYVTRHHMRSIIHTVNAQNLHYTHIIVMLACHSNYFYHRKVHNAYNKFIVLHLFIVYS